MERKKVNVLILGGSGFIGRNLVEYLKDKPRYRLFFPSHGQLELLDTSKVADFIKKNRIDIIINLASVGGTRKTAYDEGQTDVVYKNLRIFFNLTRCLDQVELMINIGSGAEYDRPHWKREMREDYFDTYVPEDAYGFSKYVCAKYIQQAKKIINLRLFAVFGKYEDYTFKFISNTIVKKLFNLPIIIRRNAFYDYLYIDDLVKIIELFIWRRPKYKIYNVASGKRVSLLTIAQKINRLSRSGKTKEITIENPGLNFEYTADISRLMEELSDFKFTPLNRALKELYQWYRERLDQMDKKSLIVDRYRQNVILKK